MLKELNLSRKISKAEYKAVEEKVTIQLGTLQRAMLEKGIPWVIVFEGWDAAGKGTLINDLILPLDPRGFVVRSTLPPTEEEAYRPFLWRFWSHTPARGRLTVFDRSWYRRVLEDRVDRKIRKRDVGQAYEDIRSFERQLADDGTVIIKFFLHISKAEQKKRFDKLRDNPATAWRVTKTDLRRHRQYGKYRDAVDEAIAETDSDFAPWTVVEAHGRRFAALKIFNTVTVALQDCLASNATSKAVARGKRVTVPEEFSASIIDRLDLTRSLARATYRRQLKKLQGRMRELEHTIYVHRIPVVIVYEGCDAAGKGGNIRRLTERLDPRGYEVVPIAAPNDIERAHHYLWRFWTQVPKAGHITIFDRSWYGRILVERVEGFCSEEEWKRAYREINEMERHLTNFGAVVLKFWLQIDKAEQLRRFKRREELAHKRWKITEEDWRNRKKWQPYRMATEEMLARTSTPNAPWTVVESNCKWFARVKVLRAVVKAIEAKLDN